LPQKRQKRPKRKRVSERKIAKLYKEFFYQLEFVLKDEGTITVLLRNPGLFVKMADKFKVIEEKEIWQGKEKFVLLVLLIKWQECIQGRKVSLVVLNLKN